MESNINSLSIIENVDIKSVESTTRKINEFQSIVSKNLKKGKDYGIIPGCSKPTLLKPGAEKILMLMGLQSTYEILDSTRDWQEGFFQYQVRCTLKKGDIIITQGLGCCNSREKKYVRQDPYTIDNTILKMAKKRSQVDATLTVASLSEIFTQDIEDMGISDDRQSHTSAPAPNTDLATMPQVTLIKKQILSSHLIKDGEKKKISGYLETGMTKNKASEIISWWLGDKSKNIEGEHAKREAKEKEAEPETKESKIKQAREIVEAPGKLEIKNKNEPFPDEVREEIEEAVNKKEKEEQGSFHNPIPFKSKKEELKKVSNAGDFINEEDLPT